jgi:hypothetical protein
MTEQQFSDLISRGCAKVNISTAVKMTFMKANLVFLRDAEAKNKWDPPLIWQVVRLPWSGLTMNWRGCSMHRPRWLFASSKTVE